MICQDCHHPNPDENRFCGQCGGLLPASASTRPMRNDQNRPIGSTLDPPIVTRTARGAEPGSEYREARSQAATNPLLSREPAMRRESTPEPRPERSARVSGPSFLGLNEPDDFSPGEHDDLYHSNWGGRLAVAFIVLLVAAALAFLQWRSSQQQARPASPPVAAPEQAPPTSPPSDPPANGQSAGTPASPSSASGAVAASAPANPSASGKPATETSASTAPSSTAQSQPSASATPTWPGTTVAGNNGDSSTNDEAKSQSSVPEGDDGASDEQNQRASDTSASAEVRSRRTEPEAVRDPEVSSQEQVRWAEVYLEGKGVPQNCDEGIGILRAAEATAPSLGVKRFGIVRPHAVRVMRRNFARKRGFT